MTKTTTPKTGTSNICLSEKQREAALEMQKAQVLERMRRGRRLRVYAGDVLVSVRPPYGYRLIEPAGRSTLEIFEHEADIVRRIFAWYTNDGLSAQAITFKLTDMNVLAPSGKPGQRWHATTVINILANETYAGLWHYGKTNGKREKMPCETWVSAPVPAIVERDTWEKAQQRRLERGWRSR